VSDAPKVVSLRGEEILPPGEPRPKVIAMLEDYLERARSGDICAVAMAVKFSDGATMFHFEGNLDNAVIGAVERMKIALVKD